MSRIAWVTGASSGVGLATAQELAAAGFHVVLSARGQEALDQATSTILQAGGAASSVLADVTDAATVKQAVDAILRQHERIDVLVANAGMNFGVRAWGEVTAADFTTLVAANLNGVFYCIDAVLPAMRQQQDGVVITVASWAGRFVGAAAGPAYTAAKHGAVALTASLNMAEFRNGIRACALCPGEIATPAMLRREVPPTAEARACMLQAEDVARTIRFVAQMPPHVCINELVMAPTWNGAFVR